MASKQSTVDFILEQMADAGNVSARKMFGEYGVYCGGKLVALVCDDQLFLKPTAAGKAFIGRVTEKSPYPGAKSWFSVAGNTWENADWLGELVRLTAAELPMPVPKVKQAKPKVVKAKPKAVKAKPAKAKPAKSKTAKKTKPKPSSSSGR